MSLTLSVPQKSQLPPEPWHGRAAALPQVLCVSPHCIRSLLSSLVTLFVPLCPCRWEERPGFVAVENIIRSYYYSIAAKPENGPETVDKAKAALP